MRRSIDGKRVLLTGASSGIGRALALRLARHRARLLITARREDRLAELALQCRQLGTEADVVVGDITQPSVQLELLEFCRRQWGALDVLVNNAGIGAVGPFHLATAERLRQVMEVNFFAPADLTRAAIPDLRQGDRPIVVNVGSVLGHVAVPKKSEYCASKFALRALSDSLRYELRPLGIDLCWVAPNTTRSEFFDHLLEQQGAVAENPLSMSPDRVARTIVGDIRRGRQHRVLTLAGRTLIRLRYLFPRIMHRILARM